MKKKHEQIEQKTVTRLEGGYIQKYVRYIQNYGGYIKTTVA